MATRRICEFLDGNHGRYVLMSHSPAYTASEVAESVHIPGRSLAKVVIVVINGDLAMAVVPATRDVDLRRLQDVTRSSDVRLADESEFVQRFDGCQLGTVPPFGNVFGVETYVDRSLSQNAFITFNAGTHTQVIVMRFEEYRRLAHPIVADIGADATASRFHVAQI